MKARFATPLLLWSLAGFVILAPVADEVVNPLARARPEPQVVVVPETRDMGALGAAFENVGDAILPGRTFRDVQFYLDEVRNVEVVATPVEEAPVIELRDGGGALTATALAPAGEQTTLMGAASAGDGNRIRLIRPQASNEPATFALRVRSAE